MQGCRGPPLAAAAGREQQEHAAGKLDDGIQRLQGEPDRESLVEYGFGGEMEHLVGGAKPESGPRSPHRRLVEWTR
jgi:hypothetical protein